MSTGNENPDATAQNSFSAPSSEEMDIVVKVFLRYKTWIEKWYNDQFGDDIIAFLGHRAKEYNEDARAILVRKYLSAKRQ